MFGAEISENFSSIGILVTAFTNTGESTTLRSLPPLNEILFYSFDSIDSKERQPVIDFVS